MPALVFAQFEYVEIVTCREEESMSQETAQQTRVMSSHGLLKVRGIRCAAVHTREEEHED